VERWQYYQTSEDSPRESHSFLSPSIGIDDLGIHLATIELARKFYANIHARDKGYFMTWLRGHPIRVDAEAELISTIIHTSRVPDPEYPWAREFREGTTQHLFYHSRCKFQKIL